jgi:hypothetical protein
VCRTKIFEKIVRGARAVSAAYHADQHKALIVKGYITPSTEVVVCEVEAVSGLEM